MKLQIDLNADLGEGAGHDEELLELVSSASIACGLHAGDSAAMQRAVVSARERGVAVGAHPGFADRENFGRTEINLHAEQVVSLMLYQIGAFLAIAGAAKVIPRHVKPHGALYNLAARNRATADAVARAIAMFDPKLILFAPFSSELSRSGSAHGLRVAHEVFADRNYLPDGSLVPRTRDNAILHDPAEAAKRMLRILRDGVVRAVDGTDVIVQADTFCVHGDTPGAVDFVKQLRDELQSAGFVITNVK